MSLQKAVVTALVAASMTSAPALAAADSASSLSVTAAQTSRAGTTIENGNELGGGFLIPLLALGAIVLGILVLLDDDDDDVESP